MNRANDDTYNFISKKPGSVVSAGLFTLADLTTASLDLKHPLFVAADLINVLYSFYQ